MRFSRHRARGRALRIVWPYVAAAAVLLLASLLGSALTHRTSAALLSSQYFAALLLGLAGGRYHRSRWAPLAPVRTEGESPEVGTNIERAAVEGSVGYVAGSDALVSPVSGTPCAYYRVWVERHDGGIWRSRSRRGWCVISDRALLVPFTVSGAGALIRVEPVADEREATLPGLLPIDVDRDLVDGVLVVESTEEGRDLPSGAREYVGSLAAGLSPRGERVRVRVTEYVLREQDAVCLVGRVQWRDAPNRASHGGVVERFGTMRELRGSSVVVPASRRDLTWLRRFDAGVVLGLALASLAALTTFAYQLLRVAGAR